MQCLAIDAQGSLLLTGDESGTLCARLLNRRHGDGDTNTRTTQYRNRVLGSKVTPDGPDGHSCVKVEGAHEGGILAMTHVEGKLRGEEGEAGGGFALFVSGGIGEEESTLQLFCCSGLLYALRCSTAIRPRPRRGYRHS